MNLPAKNRKLVIALVILTWILIIAAIVFATGAAIRKEKYDAAGALTGGNAANGLALMERYGCAACHVVPGLSRRGPSVAPSLEGVGTKSALGGAVKNEPEILVQWIMNPSAMDPKTTMPNVGVRESEARDIAAYLYASD